MLIAIALAALSLIVALILLLVAIEYDSFYWLFVVMFLTSVVYNSYSAIFGYYPAIHIHTLPVR